MSETLTHDQLDRPLRPNEVQAFRKGLLRVIADLNLTRACPCVKDALRVISSASMGLEMLRIDVEEGTLDV